MNGQIVFEAFRDPACIVDGSGIIVRANEVLATALGFVSTKQLIGENVCTIIPHSLCATGPHTEAIKKFRAQDFSSGACYHQSCTLLPVLDANDEEKLAYLSVIPLSGVEGQTQFFAAFDFSPNTARESSSLTFQMETIGQIMSNITPNETFEMNSKSSHLSRLTKLMKQVLQTEINICRELFFACVIFPPNTSSNNNTREPVVHTKTFQFACKFLLHPRAASALELFRDTISSHFDRPKRVYLNLIFFQLLWPELQLLSKEKRQFLIDRVFSPLYKAAEEELTY